MVGSELGHYKILSALGAGGMGEVYLADDTKLDRQVAIKVLPESLRSDDTRLERFRREARASASLKHPNIATIHALEEAGDQLFIVMEYVEGKTLAEHIPSEGMELEAFFEAFIPLADALAHAHDNGRIHRDIKPGNIMLTDDGTPKILDFGLARIEREGDDVLESDTPTLTMKEIPPSLTQGRSFLGTPVYMSPEQIEGGKVDPRTDVFSFGVVMYEALTGQRPFKGDTVESVIARILEIDPAPATELKPTSPYMLWQVIRKCLVKDRRGRMQTAWELHNELESVQSEMQAGTVLVDASTIPEPASVLELQSATVPLWRQPAAIGLSIIMLIVGLGAAWLLTPEPPPRLRTFTLPLPAQVSPFVGPVLSPDGARVAYQEGSGTSSQLKVRDLDHTEPRDLATSGIRPFFSPDSRKIGFFTFDAGALTLRTISVDGGPSTPVVDLPVGAFPRRGAWTTDGRIVYGVAQNVTVAGSGYLMRVAAGGGKPELFLAPDTTAGEVGVIHPHMLPDGATVVASLTTEAAGTLVAVSGERRVSLVSHAGDVLAYPVYAPSGHLIYQRGLVGGAAAANTVATSVWAVPFDPDGPALTGEPFLVADGVQTPTVSADGTLLYSSPGEAVPGKDQLVWVDRSGQITGTIGREQTGMHDPALSPDGHRVAVRASEQSNFDIWVHDVSRGTALRLTFDLAFDQRPVWSPDGTRVAFTSALGSGSDAFAAPSDASGSAALLVSSEGYDWVTDWSRDGRQLLFYSNRSGTFDIYYLTLDGAAAVQLTDTPHQVQIPRLSPDGRYVTYVSNELGRNEIFVTRFPSGQGKWQVSVEGGQDPRWSRKGDEMFFTSGSALLAVGVRTSGAFEAGTPKALFSADSATPPLRIGTNGLSDYDVALDGRRFVMVQQVTENVPGIPTITLVQDWASQFQERE